MFGETLLSLGVSATGAQNLKLTQETITNFEENEHVLDAAPLARFPALITFKGLISKYRPCFCGNSRIA